MGSWWNRWALLLSLLLGLGVSPAVLADSPTPAKVMPSTMTPWVDVGVMMIHAKEEPGKTDARLEPMLSSLKQLPFGSYAFIDQRRVRLLDGAAEAVQLSDRLSLGVKLLGHDTTEAPDAFRSTKTAKSCWTRR